MNIKANTVLITGGATGIGLALAEAFLKDGNAVAICGRRAERLAEAKARLPRLITRQCDVTNGTERAALARWAEASLPNLNLLINNAGIQRMTDLHTEGDDGGRDQVETNLIAPISLSAYFTPLLGKRPHSAIVNVSSGLGFVPIAAMPVYCATKAALHSFTVSQRFQLKDTSIKVFELIPPAVSTELGRVDGEEEPSYPGIPPAEVAEAALEGLARDQYEIAVGEATGLVAGSCKDFAGTFQRLNQW
jgi:uncharacterized oxidoreductase